MLRLQPNMTHIKAKVNGSQKCKNAFTETKKDKSERIAETTKATAQDIEMAMWYTLVDRTLCFSGQRMA